VYKGKKCNIPSLVETVGPERCGALFYSSPGLNCRQCYDGVYWSQEWLLTVKKTCWTYLQRFSCF